MFTAAVRDQVVRQLDELEVLFIQSLPETDAAREPVVDKNRGVVERWPDAPLLLLVRGRSHGVCVSECMLLAVSRAHQ